MRYTWAVFVVTFLTCGLLYWWFTDWWAYVEFPDGLMPKFVMPWWWQVVESSVVGLLAGGLAAEAWWVGCWASLRRVIHQEVTSRP